jgi:alkaline phosphatase
MAERGGQIPYFCKKIYFMQNRVCQGKYFHAFFSFLLISLFSYLNGSFQAFSQAKQQVTKPKNFILIIGDGMGFNTIRATDFFQGKEKQSYEEFPVRLAMATFPAISDEDHTGDQSFRSMSTGYDPVAAWKDPGYVKKNITESAAAATAMAAGVKTRTGFIGLSLESDTLVNLVETAKSTGKSAGVVTSVEFSHATPAAFVTHNESRSNYSRIARDMILNSRCDVIMGCGNPAFDDNGKKRVKNWEDSKYVGDSIFWVQLLKGTGWQTQFTSEGKIHSIRDTDGDGIPDPWTIIQDVTDFRKLQQGPAPKRVLGCAKIYSTLQQSRSLLNGETKNSPPFVTPFIPTVPTLAEMVRGALHVLENNPKGFFLMVEGGAVDFAAHANQKGRLIEEMISLNQAIEAVIEWVNTRSSWTETLVVFTGDHETGYLWGGPPFEPVRDQGPGKLPVMYFNSTNHTNSLVPFFAKGEGCELYRNFAEERDSVRGPYIENSEIAPVIKFLWTK